MKAHVVRSLQSGVVLLLASVLLNACGTADWQPHAANAEKIKPTDLAKAEAEYRQAIKVAEKGHVPETAYLSAIQGLGEVLLDEKKYGAAVPYLVKACQLATATHMSDEANIALLQKVVVAYENSGEPKEAVDTQSVLMTFLSVEKSPADPIFIKEKANQGRLEDQLASYNKAHLASKCCEHEQ